MANQVGSFIIDIEGTTLTPEDKEILAHPLVGGVIFFTRNYESRTQMQELTSQIRGSRPNPSLLMVDQEGGRVQRFINEFTRLPPMGTLGRLYDSNPDKACAMAKNCGWLMAAEILSLGIDLSLAPVLDLNKGVSSVIGDRAFHSQPDTVIRLASAFILGMQEAGMAATGKHFPGHGSQQADSHIALPRDERNLLTIMAEDMEPFAYFARHHMAGMMAAHIVFPQIDSLPVSYSRIWLQDILRQQLGFKGIIFSDDLNMEGANISQNYADRVLAAREAGCDFTLLCNNRRGVIQVLDTVDPSNLEIAKAKWLPLQGRIKNFMYEKSQQWHQTQQFLQELSMINGASTH